MPNLIQLWAIFPSTFVQALSLDPAEMYETAIWTGFLQSHCMNGSFWPPMHAFMQILLSYWQVPVGADVTS